MSPSELENETPSPSHGRGRPFNPDCAQPVITKEIDHTHPISGGGGGQIVPQMWRPGDEWGAQLAAALRNAETWRPPTRRAFGGRGEDFALWLRAVSAAKAAKIRARFAKRTRANPDTGCIEWVGGIGGGGYGIFSYGGHKSSRLGAHRAAWILAHGPVDAGLLVRHFWCANKRCVNVEHLALGTLEENQADELFDAQHDFEHPYRSIVRGFAAALLWRGLKVLGPNKPTKQLVFATRTKARDLRGVGQ